MNIKTPQSLNIARLQNSCVDSFFTKFLSKCPVKRTKGTWASYNNKHNAKIHAWVNFSRHEDNAIFTSLLKSGRFSEVEFIILIAFLSDVVHMSEYYNFSNEEHDVIRSAIQALNFNGYLRSFTVKPGSKACNALSTLWFINVGCKSRKIDIDLMCSAYRDFIRLAQREVDVDLSNEMSIIGVSNHSDSSWLFGGYHCF